MEERATAKKATAARSRLLAFLSDAARLLKSLAVGCLCTFACTAWAQWPGVASDSNGNVSGNSGWPTNTTDHSVGPGAHFRCSVFGEFSYQGALQLGPRDPRIDQMIEDIVRVTGLKKNFEVYSSPNVPNAAAWVEGETRKIAYNPHFLDQMIRQTGTEWSVRSIMAHEIGHHLQGHTIQRGGSRPPIELEADSYSGAVVRWLGGTLSHAQAAMSALAPERGSATHPGRRERLAAIGNGYDAAGTSRGASGRVDTSPRQPSQPPNTIPAPFPAPDVNQAATACCGLVGPMCQMLTATPRGSPCVCYLLGQPVATGVGC